MKRILFLCVCAVMVGCKSPFDRTRDASGGGPTGVISGNANFVVFSSELATGGGAFEFPGSDGQSLTFSDTSNPISNRSIRYNWTGQQVTNLGCPAQNPSNFAGFDLFDRVNQTDYAMPGRNFSAAGYTKVTFYARGSLSSNTVLKVEVASPGSPADACAAVNSPCITLSTNGTDDACSPNGPGTNSANTMPPRALTNMWQPYTITIPNPPQQLSNIRDFFKATFVFTPAFGATSGQGGTVYLDQIQYQQ